MSVVQTFTQRTKLLETIKLNTMKKIRQQKQFITTFIFVFIMFLSFGNYNKIQSVQLLNNGTYVGHTTCTCCQQQANKPGKDYEITVKFISANKVSFNNLAHQMRDIEGYVENGKIIIDERKLGLKELFFWGTVEIKDKNTFKLDVEWADNSVSRHNTETLNHCIGTFTIN